MKKDFNFSYDRYEPLDTLPAEDRELVSAAREACRMSYAPHSDFRVGAAARLQSGRVITGSNQESEVFPVGLCAERVVLLHHAATNPEDRITTLAIASVPGERECYPCGICRQTLSDIQKRQGTPIRVIMSGNASATVIDDAAYLLPFTFEL